jgi:hypothetical protein
VFATGLWLLSAVAALAFSVSVVLSPARLRSATAG